ncbi:MAG: pyruvate dehydrogenase complex dihydrolipoamide acetyltransferase [Bacteroidetes bacterium]|nr:pyruvate dehydrogenase complex dihydrolipoamide acetyltransferase [Bacteroidota bacterium]
MAEIVRMPKLSDTMTEGTVSRWLKKVGDKVKSGDILAEIDSDKATMEFESFYDGVLLYIGTPDKKSAPVDSVLAIIGKEGENVAKILEEEKKKVGSVQTAVGKKEEIKKTEPQKESQKSEVKNQKVMQGEQVVSTSNIQHPAPGFIKASPLAKKLAKDRNLKISLIGGSGEGGRVVRKDIENYLHFSVSPSGGGKGEGKESFTDEPVSQMRKTIAKRLSESKFTSPHFYLTMEISVEELVKVRETINEVSSVKISYNDLVIKAVSSALREHPKVNSSWMGDVIRRNNHIHIGIAVAVEEGLLVPVIKFADGKTLSQIAGEVKEFSKKAKEKKLQPKDWEGNTFTISNLGMYGIEEFTAIINPPDACILAVGGITETPVVKDGKIVPGVVMKVTLSCDHRVVDGVTGADFLQTLKTLLENPVLFLGAQSI